jgi:hypothetical protein
MVASFAQKLATMSFEMADQIQPLHVSPKGRQKSCCNLTFRWLRRKTLMWKNAIHQTSRPNEEARTE